jgi:bacteriocin biosynthesis cyclodehydratase domain-containing protein
LATTVRLVFGGIVPRINVLAIDDFGAQVGARLQSIVPTCDNIANPGREFGEHISSANLVVVAAAKPVPSVWDELDHGCFERRISWIPVLHDCGAVTIGPLVAPGVGPCHRCYLRRAMQHSVDWEIDQAVMDFYRANPTSAPAGYLPPAASLAASVIAEIVNRLRHGDFNDVGQVKHFDLLEWQVTSDRVLGIHGCNRCGLRRDDSARTTSRLAEWFAKRNGVHA